MRNGLGDWGRGLGRKKGHIKSLFRAGENILSRGRKTPAPQKKKSPPRLPPPKQR